MGTDFYLAQRARTRFAFWLLVALVLMLGTSSGCALLSRHNDWDAPAPYSTGYNFGAANAPLNAAELQLVEGQRAETAGSAACIDYHFAAATLSWPYQATSTATPDDHATSLYRSAVRSFIESATRFGRLDRRQGVVLSNNRLVPVTYHGFVWQPEDFCTFIPVGSYDSHRLSDRYASDGVGVPYVVLTTNTPRLPFTNILQPFAATAVVAPMASGSGFSLQFYDPLRTATTANG